MSFVVIKCCHFRSLKLDLSKNLSVPNMARDCIKTEHVNVIIQNEEKCDSIGTKLNSALFPSKER